MVQPTAAVHLSTGNERRSETSPERIDTLFENQREFFRSGATLSRDFREQQLRGFEAGLHKHSELIIDALHTDLHRGRTEAYLIEIQMVLGEIRHTLRHLGRWMKPRSSFSPLATAISRSYVHRDPLGLNLIIAPWNYPVQLALAPLVGAIAAGNVALVKPSELAPASAAAVATIIADTFAEAHVAAATGGVETSQALLAKPWDHVFFTGGTDVGRIVARAAAEHLARCTLELGGKSPTIVTESADLDVAARRITWGKFLNAGQTCIAPDYLLVHEAVQAGLLTRIRKTIKEFYGDDPRESDDYARVVNDRHFERIVRLIDPSKVYLGGRHDRAERYIEPTIMTDVTLDDEVMRDEIFGPILPVITIGSIDDAIRIVEQRRNPLALYLFSTDPAEQDAVVERLSFGGGCINNVAMHFTDPALPFGGVGSSGMGSYHGRWSIDAFSHTKGVMKSSTLIDPSVKYPPFSEEKLSIIKKLM